MLSVCRVAANCFEESIKEMRLLSGFFIHSLSFDNAKSTKKKLKSYGRILLRGITTPCDGLKFCPSAFVDWMNRRYRPMDDKHCVKWIVYDSSWRKILQWDVWILIRQGKLNIKVKSGDEYRSVRLLTVASMFSGHAKRVQITPGHIWWEKKIDILLSI